MEQSSYLLSLPAEIRCQIYRHLFINCCLRANAAHYPEIGTPADIREEQHQFPPNTKRKNLQPPSPVVNIFLACSPARGFPVTLHWRIGWRFLEFAGDCDLDEWCLQVYNADLLGTDAHIPKHYFKQESMFYEMG